jgi:putative two-component system response regulator
METRADLPNILIVDDEIGPRESLRMILKPNYNVFTVEDGYTAIQMVQQKEFDAIALDLKMAGLSGIETLREIRAVDPGVMVIIITGYGTLESAIEAIRYDVFDYILKPFNVTEIICIVEKAIRRKKLNTRMKEFMSHFSDQHPARRAGSGSDLLSRNRIDRINDFSWEDATFQDSETCLDFVKVLAYTLEEKDPYTSGHSERVCYYADFISRKLPLSEKERGELQVAAYLHDIGKIGISNRFINKKGALSPTDWAIIKQHTKKSIELLSPLKLSAKILSYIRHHHEHFDGTGYPDGLSDDRIPLGARIISISDSYDSMTSNRPYRKPLPNDEAKRELLRCAGSQFDPSLVSIFLTILREMDELFQMKDHLRVPSLSY